MVLKLTLLTLFAVASGVEGYSLSDVQQLKKKLFVDNNYDKTMRPIYNQSKAMKIDMFMGITGLTSLDMTTGKLVSPGYLYLSWIDEQLVWNSSEYNNLKRLTVSTSDIWTPKIAQVTGIEIPHIVAPTWVSDSGRITWLIASSLEGDCSLDVKRYPFDKHDCTFSVQPSAYDASEIELGLLSNASGTAVFVEHGEWEVIGSHAFLMKFIEPLSGVWFDAYFQSVTLSRRYLFVAIHTSIPYCLLVLLNTMIFVVPIRSGERVTFSMTILLAFIFFTSNISDDLPHNSLKSSYVSIGMAALNVATTLGIITNVILCRADSETITPVPVWLKRIAFKYQSHRKNQKTPVTSVESLSVVEQKTMPIIKQNSFELERNVSVDDYEDIKWIHVAGMFDYGLFYINFILMIVLGGCSVTIGLM